MKPYMARTGAGCTWKGCAAAAVHDQLDRNGNRWASLCQAHHDELDRSIEQMNPAALLRSWVLASGGNPMTRPVQP